MSWYGRIIGGSIGAIFGPGGMVAGAIPAPVGEASPGECGRVACGITRQPDRGQPDASGLDGTHAGLRGQHTPVRPLGTSGN